MIAAHVADGSEVVVDLLSSIGKAPKFAQLEREGDEGAVVFEVEGVAAFVEAGLQLVREVGEELLSQGTGPGGDGIGGGGIEGGDDGEKLTEDVRGGVVSFLLGGGIESRRSEGAQLVEDSLGGCLIADDGANVVTFQDV